MCVECEAPSDSERASKIVCAVVCVVRVVLVAVLFLFVVVVGLLVSSLPLR